MNSLLEIALAPRPTASAEARRALQELAQRLPEGCYEDLRLLVSELVTNSVRHSGSNGQGRILLTVGQAFGCLRVEVTDAGSGFDKAVRLSTEEQESGWGLQIVDSLSQRWGVVRSPGSGSTVWFELEL